MSTTDSTAVPPRPTAQQIVDDLFKAVLDGRLRRGQKLPSARTLASDYRVSGNTVREAIQALVTMHMIEVRPRCGTYVTADVEGLLDASMRSAIGLDWVSLPEVLEVLTALNTYCAELAADRAFPDEITELRDALNQVENSDAAIGAGPGLKRFLFGLATASHNPLLGCLCRSLITLQIELAHRIPAGAFDGLRRTPGFLTDERRALVDAIEQADDHLAAQLARTYHQRARDVLNKVCTARSPRP